MKGGEKKNMNFKSRILTAIATGAVLVSALAPMASADTVNVTGNGALSNNTVSVASNTTTAVNQSNNANISNNIKSDASTGDNSSDFNTGGSTTIKTGNATTNVTVNNAANLNQANLPSCACNSDPTNISVGGNGAYSSNEVGALNTSSVFVNQTNNANYNNDVNATSSTGKNDDSYNTGGGSIIVSGDASTNVNVTNAANANVANVGAGVGGSDPSDPTSNVDISGNGAFSTNAVALEQDSAVVLSQDNNANIKNKIDADAKTGDNSEQFNTGGFDGIQSGNATDNVGVNNFANFNAASLSCDCTLSNLGVSVGGNGAESANEVAASSSNSTFPSQVNSEGLWNSVGGGAKTGDNALGYSTGNVYNDPVVFTGDSSSTTSVNNEGNANVLNNGTSITLPNGWSVGMNFDLSGLEAFVNGLI